jgi:hypothetical protein
VTQDHEQRIAALEAYVTDHEKRLAALETRVSELEQGEPDLPSPGHNIRHSDPQGQAAQNAVQRFHESKANW